MELAIPAGSMPTKVPMVGQGRKWVQSTRNSKPRFGRGRDIHPSESPRWFLESTTKNCDDTHLDVLGRL